MSYPGSPTFLQRCRSSRWLGIVAAATHVFFTGSLALQAAPIPSDKPAAYPSWWFQREVVKRINPNDTTPSWLSGSYLAADDFAAVNVGQLKQIATAAYDELNAHLPGGAGATLDTLVKSWFQVDGSNNFLFDAQGKRQPKVTPQTNDFTAANLGQLKAVAKPFYDRLIAVQFASAYPWTNTSADDYASANLGQLKRVFSFDPLLVDTDQNGLPDWWELLYFGYTGVDPNALAPSGDGLTILQKYLRGKDPDLFEDVSAAEQSPIRLIVYTPLQ